MSHIPNGTSFTDDGSYAIWGRPVQNELDFSNGAWNADYLNQVGSYYEKVLALQLMLEASSETINFYRFDAIDARLRFVNFTHLWPDGMRQLLGVLLTDDTNMYAPRVGTRDHLRRHRDRHRARRGVPGRHPIPGESARLDAAGPARPGRRCAGPRAIS